MKTLKELEKTLSYWIKHKEEISTKYCRSKDVKELIKGHIEYVRKIKLTKLEKKEFCRLVSYMIADSPQQQEKENKALLSALQKIKYTLN